MPLKVSGGFSGGKNTLTLAAGTVQEVIRHSTHAPQIAVNSKQLIHIPWRRAFFPPTHTYNIHMTFFLLLSIIGLFISHVTYNTVYIVYLTDGPK